MVDERAGDQDDGGQGQESDDEVDESIVGHVPRRMEGDHVAGGAKAGTDEADCGTDGKQNAIVGLHEV